MRIPIQLLVGLLLAFNSYGQSSLHDSIRDDFNSKVNAPPQNADSTLSTLLAKVEIYATEINQINKKIEGGYTGPDVEDELSELEQHFQLINTLINNKLSKYSMRSLYGGKVLMVQMITRLTRWEKELAKYTQKLRSMRATLNKVKNDSTLLQLPEDSLVLIRFAERYAAIAANYQRADTAVRSANISAGLLLNRILRLQLSATETIEAIDNDLLRQLRNLHKRDGANLLQATRDSVPVAAVLTRSLRGSSIVLPYFFATSWRTRFVEIVLFLLLWAWLYFNKNAIKRTGGVPLGARYDSAYKSPFLAALFVSLSLSALFYSSPPLLYFQMLWCVAYGIAIVLLWNKLARPWLVLAAVCGFLLFCFAALSILYTYTTNTRWLLAICCILMLGLAAATYRFGISAQKLIFWKPALKTVTVVLIAGAVFSLVANFSGRVGLAKMLGQAGFYGWLLGLLYGLVVGVLQQGINMHANAHRSGSRFLFSLDSQSALKSVYNNLRIAGVACWLVLMLKNISLFDLLYSDFMNWLERPLRIGNSSFSISSICIFFLVLWLANLVSQLASFLLRVGQDEGVTKKRHYSLLIFLRMALLGGGVLLAFAASGIPLDKLTIVLGALSVGIGFGLQNVVNNLVSGVILAFEKPVQVGDVIEVGPRTGTVREIGIRSSKILTYEGAEVIVPNGDLISHQIINWTLTNNHKRLEVIIGVHYNSDLNKAQDAIERAFVGQKDLLLTPEPAVYAHIFNASSIDFRVLFWCNMNSNFLALKSEVIKKIHQNLAEAGIQIPFPQQDVYIKEMPNLGSAPP
jgi:small-conductance mechanosensitive channel